jgi:tetratricopeptide (TPR) repeat protein
MNKPSTPAIQAVATGLLIVLSSAPAAPAQLMRDLLVLQQTNETNPATEEELIDHIQYGGESAASLQQRFSDRIAESPEALCRMGNRFARERNPEQAQKMYEQSIKLKPGAENLTALAKLFLSQGDEAGWLKTMEQRLELPYDRRNDAYTNRDIADHFITKGEWEKALPYAEAAAIRGYYWAYYQTAWLNGSMGNTQRGLEWMERYETQYWGGILAIYILTFNAKPSDWSNQLLDHHYQLHIDDTSSVERAKCAAIALIRKDYEAAASLMEQGLKELNDPLCGLQAALLCEEQGWIERRDKILQETVERWPQYTKKSQSRFTAKAVIDLYIQANQVEKLTLELKTKLQRIFDTCGRGSADFNGAHVGELCHLKGEREMAKAMYTEIISVKRNNKISDYIAFRGLRLLGEDPVKILQERRAKLVEQSAPQGAAQ